MRDYSFIEAIRQAGRGRLKVYLGYSPGVGKTWQMLQEAQRLQAAGVKVVAGWVDTHGQPFLTELAQGIAQADTVSTVFHGIRVAEMDTKKVLASGAEVALVDELAHANLPGQPNRYRYQDVEALLAHGIHVISTLNIEHLESLNNTVEAILGQPVSERLPDFILTGADEVVNVDITPEDLLARVNRGMVLTQPGEDRFRSDKLAQLRELALRELAAHIDNQSRRLNEEVSNPDQVMVCISSKSPRSRELIRYASRLAGRLNRNWYVVFVRNEREDRALTEENTQKELDETLELAKNLGGLVFNFKGGEVVKTIVDFVGEYRVGHVIIGSTGKALRLWEKLMGQTSLAEKLLTACPNISLIILNSTTSPLPSGTVNVADDEVMWRTMLRHSRGTELKAITIDDVLKALLTEARHIDKTLNVNAAVSALQEREKRGSTFIGQNLAIPHVRLPNIKAPLLVVGVNNSPILDSITRTTARVFFLLLIPKDNPEAHIYLLGRLSRFLQESAKSNKPIEKMKARELLAKLRRYI